MHRLVPSCFFPIALAGLSLGGCFRAKETPPAVTASVGAATAVAPPSPSVVRLPKPQEVGQQFSYTYGYLVYQTLREQGFQDIDPQYFAQGATDAAEGTSLFSQEEMTSILKTVQNQLLERAKQEYQRIADENAKEAEAFFAENASRPEVSTLDNGVQYQVLSLGDEERPLIGMHDTVSVEYRVTKLDGTFLFGTSQRGHSDTFVVDTLPDGLLKTGICMLHPGARYRFWVPYRVADDVAVVQSLEPECAVVVELSVVSVVYADR